MTIDETHYYCHRISIILNNNHDCTVLKCSNFGIILSYCFTLTLKINVIGITFNRIFF